MDPDPSSPPIASILRNESNPYWKASTYTNIQDIFSLIQRESSAGGKFMGIIIQEISEGLEFFFFDKKKKFDIWA